MSGSGVWAAFDLAWPPPQRSLVGRSKCGACVFRRQKKSEDGWACVKCGAKHECNTADCVRSVTREGVVCTITGLALRELYTAHYGHHQTGDMCGSTASRIPVADRAWVRKRNHAAVRATALNMLKAAIKAYWKTPRYRVDAKQVRHVYRIKKHVSYRDIVAIRRRCTPPPPVSPPSQHVIEGYSTRVSVYWHHVHGIKPHAEDRIRAFTAACVELSGQGCVFPLEPWAKHIYTCAKVSKSWPSSAKDLRDIHRFIRRGAGIKF